MEGTVSYVIEEGEAYVDAQRRHLREGAYGVRQSPMDLACL